MRILKRMIHSRENSFSKESFLKSFKMLFIDYREKGKQVASLQTEIIVSSIIHLCLTLKQRMKRQSRNKLNKKFFIFLSFKSFPNIHINMRRFSRQKITSHVAHNHSTYQSVSPFRNRMLSRKSLAKQVTSECGDRVSGL